MLWLIKFRSILKSYKCVNWFEQEVVSFKIEGNGYETWQSSLTFVFTLIVGIDYA